MSDIFISRLTELVGGRSVAEFARVCGQNQQTVQRWLSGERTPSGVGLAAVARACGVSVDWLLGLAAVRAASPPDGGAVCEAGLYDPSKAGDAEAWRELALSQQRVIERLAGVVAAGGRRAAAPAVGGGRGCAMAAAGGD